MSASSTEVASSPPDTSWIDGFRSELIFPCSDGLAASSAASSSAASCAATTSTFTEMRAAVCDFMGRGAGPGGVDDLGLASGDALSRLHEGAAADDFVSRPVPVSPSLIHGFRHGGHPLPKQWRSARKDNRKLIRRLEQDEAYQRFIAAYQRFVQETIAPRCGDPSGVAYQCPPTLRVHMPGRAPTIAQHCDSEYDRHHAGEINFWVPLTPVGGTNTLWTESEPGKADFHPFDLPTVGQAVRFNGYKCRHYTLANETGQTRVSFDFRCIPLSVWRDEFNGNIGDYRHATALGPIQLVGPPGLPFQQEEQKGQEERREQQE